MKRPVHHNHPAGPEQPSQGSNGGGNPNGPQGSNQPGRNQRPAVMQEPYEPPKLEDRPEVVHTYYQIWTVLLGMEIIHQILNLVMSILSRDVTAATLQQLGVEEDSNISDSLLMASVIGAAVVNFLVILGILAYAVYGLRKIHTGQKGAAIHLRVLNFFAIYFMVRGIFTFFASPDGTLPVAFYAVDGCLRIAIGVAGVLLIWAGGKRETLDWLGVKISDKAKRKDS